MIFFASTGQLQPQEICSTTIAGLVPGSFDIVFTEKNLHEQGAIYSQTKMHVGRRIRPYGGCGFEHESIVQPLIFGGRIHQQIGQGCLILRLEPGTDVICC